jgi:hypothetical protein
MAEQAGPRRLARPFTVATSALTKHPMAPTFAVDTLEISGMFKQSLAACS